MTSKNSNKTKEMLSNFLKGDSKTHESIEELLSGIRREKIEKPIIYVGAGTCGLGAGAGKTIESINKYISEHAIDADLIEVGCIGLCKAEPIVDIQLPGKSRISFQYITHEKVEKLLDSIFCNSLEGIDILGQFDTKGSKKWEGAKNFYEHPFFVKQKRIVLKNCGLINP